MTNLCREQSESVTPDRVPEKSTSIEPIFFEGTIIPSIDSITPNAKLINIMEMESGNKNYIYELNYDIVFEYVVFLKNDCRYQIIENEEEFISLGPSGIYDDYVFVDIWSDLGVFAVTTCCVDAYSQETAEVPESREETEINNNVDFINGIFDIIKKRSPEMRTYGFYEYYNDLEYRLSFEMPDLKIYLSSIPEEQAEQIKSRAQNKAYDAYRHVINNSPYGNLSGAVIGSAVEAAYNSYIDVLLAVYRN